MQRTESFDTVVIGAGQAGLSVARELAERDIDAVVLSDEGRIGDNWRRRWDTLRLFTPAEYNGLPGMPFPAPPGHFADKDEVADYLARYAERFDLPVRTSTRVTSVEAAGRRFHVRSGDTVIAAENVVVATGAFQQPRIPAIAHRLAADIHQLHSSEYRNTWALPDGPVLVVGAGNSGSQIALELAQFRKVWLAGRDPGRIPRRILGRDVFHWTWPIMSRATVATRLGKKLQTRSTLGGDPTIGISRSTLASAGITRLGRVTGERGGLPSTDASVVHPRVVIWATGFQPDYSWIKLPVVNEHGQPRHRRGVAENAAGLYFVGLRFQHRLSSSLLGGVGADAAFVADDILRRFDARFES